MHPCSSVYGVSAALLLHAIVNCMHRAAPSKRPLRRGSKVVGGYVQQANGEFETIDTTDDDEDADDDVTINAPLAEHAANDGACV